MDEESSLARQLRQAREQQRKTLEQVHCHTGLSLRVLQGLEAGEFTVVEPVYVRLALRSYAEHLGLNATGIVQRFDAMFYRPSPLPPAPPRLPGFSLARLAGWINLMFSKVPQ